MFKLVSKYKPAGDQQRAIDELVKGINNNKRYQVLLGGTGTGKTFTIANVISKINKSSLIIVHNKTLAMQLYLELKELFPSNRVEYFVSNFDFYQPEAYIPSKDLYIGKNSKENMELNMMRLSAMNALSVRKDVIVVASVAAIFGIQNPLEYKKLFFELKKGQKLSRRKLLVYLVSSGYIRNDIELKLGTFSVKGDVIKIALGGLWGVNNNFIRVDLFEDEVYDLAYVDRLTGDVIKKVDMLTIFPTQYYIIKPEVLNESIYRIEAELIERLYELKSQNKFLEASRLKQRTESDLESLREWGVCSGIENYSRHLDLRLEGEPPYNLIDYFNDEFLTIIDESHITLPQIRAMYNTDRNRKEVLVNYGFRLKSALDNRPLNFEEFNNKINKVIYISATPGNYELQLVNYEVTEQIIRPTGLLDPTIEIKNTIGQIDDIIKQIRIRKKNKERVFVTTLTIRMAEDLTSYLQDRNINVAYLHNELKTLERSQILYELRKGVYDCVVGVNLIREGIDIPEISLICILDADKQGFLRNEKSLIQIIGRAARNVNGHVILYADTISVSMKKAIDETNRRRKIQIDFNRINGIVPQTIVKPINNDFLNNQSIKEKLVKIKNRNFKKFSLIKNSLINDLKNEMFEASKKLQFEKAAEIRDIIIELELD